MRYLTAVEAASLLEVSVPTLKRYIYEGKIASTKLPGGQHRIPESEIIRLLTPQASPTTHPSRDGSSATTDARVATLETWVTDLEAEVERLSAALEVLARHCLRVRAQQDQKGVPPVSEPEGKTHEVAVLGPGCRRCDALYEATMRVVSGLSRDDVRVARVKDLDEIAAFGPVLTPALVVDGALVLSGRVPRDRALADLLRRHVGPGTT